MLEKDAGAHNVHSPSLSELVMKALVVTEYAHPSKLQLTRDAPEPVPKPGSDELLIDVHSAGLNFFDVRS